MEQAEFVTLNGQKVGSEHILEPKNDTEIRVARWVRFYNILIFRNQQDITEVLEC